MNEPVYFQEFIFQKKTKTVEHLKKVSRENTLSFHAVRKRYWLQGKY